MPGSTITHGLPSAPIAASGLDFSTPYAAKNPARASSASGAAVKPQRASSTADSALRAAQPVCNGFVIVPKLRRTPLAIELAMPKNLTELS